MDSWVGCTLNKGLQPEGQIGADFGSYSPGETMCCVGQLRSCLPEPSLTGFADTEASWWIRWASVELGANRAMCHHSDVGLIH